MGAERKSWAGLALAALIIVVAGCGGQDRTSPSPPPTATVTLQADAETTVPDAADQAPPPTDPQSTKLAGETTTPPTSAADPRTLDLDVPDGAYAVIWVRHGSRVTLRTDPGGGSVVASLGKRTEFGSPTVLGVARQVGRWAAVTTAKLPNGRLAWVKLDPRRLNGGWTRLSIVVDLSGAARDAPKRRPRRARFPGDRRRARRRRRPRADSRSPTPSAAVSTRPRTGAARWPSARPSRTCRPGWLGGNRIAIHGTSGTARRRRLARLRARRKRRRLGAGRRGPPRDSPVSIRA